MILEQPSFSEILNGYRPHLERLGIAPPARLGLETFLNRLRAENRHINLVSRKLSPEMLVEDHLFDGLIALPFLPRARLVADLGSGGGFPAIPLALCLPETRFLLFEKSPLKRRFLNSLQDFCPNIEILGNLVDEGLSSGVDLVMARGFKPIKTILNLTEHYFAADGLYMLYKARKTKIEAERCDAQLAPGSMAVQVLKPVGRAEERHLVFIKRRGGFLPE